MLAGLRKGICELVQGLTRARRRTEREGLAETEGAFRSEVLLQLLTGVVPLVVVEVVEVELHGWWVLADILVKFPSGILTIVGSSGLLLLFKRHPGQACIVLDAVRASLSTFLV